MTNNQNSRMTGRRPAAQLSDKARRRAFTRENRRWPALYRLVATSALAAYSPIGTETLVTARAQEPPPLQPEQSRTSQDHHRWQFKVGPGPLVEVLEGISNATGLRIEVATAELREVQSPGVTGLLGWQSALERALRGTQTRFILLSDESIRIELQPVSARIDVVGTPAPSGPLYTAPVRETPQTFTVIGEETIASQAATTLRDVLRNVTGLTVNAGEGGQPAGDNLVLRGFSARNDIFVDGSRDLGPQARDPYNVEQVEVVKGPQSTFTGRGSAGGSINLSSKTASLAPFVRLTTLAGTDRTKRGTADINAPLGLLGERTGFRLNLMGHDSGVAGRDVVRFRRWGVAPTLSLGLGSPTRWTFGFAKLEQDNISDYGIPWVPGSNNALAAYRNQPAPVPRNTFYGFRDRDHEIMGSDSLTVRFEHDFSDRLSVRNQFRYGDSMRDSIATPPRFASPDGTDINRNMRSWITGDKIHDNRADLTATFRTVSIRHSVVTGFALTREANVRGYRSAPAQVTSLLNPDPDEPYLGAFTVSPDRADLTGDTRSVYAFDTLRLGRRWQASGGARLDSFNAAGIAIVGRSRVPTPFEQEDSMLSLRGGLVFNPVDAGSLYVSYGSSLNPSIEGLSYGFSPNNLGLEPERTHIVEGGSKWDLFDDRLLITGALFDVRKTNARTPGLLPDDPPIILDGLQTVQGVELGATGRVTPSWMVFAGYTFMDSVIAESNDESQVGNRFPQTPRQSMNLWTTLDLPGSVTVGGGARFVGERFNNVSNVRRVGGYWTADLMAEFPLHERLRLRLNAFNLTNEYYFDRVGGGHVIPGPARSLMAGLDFRF